MLLSELNLQDISIGHKRSVIYLVVCSVNNKMYIGQRKVMETKRRYKTHLNGKNLKPDVELYGWDKFSMFVIQIEPDKLTRNKLEEFYILELRKTYGTDMIYNESNGMGQLGLTGDKSACTGRKLTNEHIQSIKNSRKVRKLFIYNITFDHTRQAASILNVTRGFILRNLNNENNKNYIYK